MIADDNDEPLHPDLLPTDHVEAMRRFEAVRTLDPAALAGLEKQDLLLGWWSFYWLEPVLHPDDVKVWPEEVAEVLPFAAEAFRRYEANKIDDGEYYPAEAVRHRILYKRALARRSQHQKRIRPKRERRDQILPNA